MELLCVSHPLERIIPGVEFAPEIVGNGRNGIVGPFEAMQGSVLSKTDYSILCGCIAEINEDVVRSS